MGLHGLDVLDGLGGGTNGASPAGKTVFVEGDHLMFADDGRGHVVDVSFESQSATVIIGCIRVSLGGWLLLRRKVQKAVSEGV